MASTRKHYTAQERASILREHLIDGIPVSDLCDKHRIHPAVFYRWQQTLFENLVDLFEAKSRGVAKQKNNQVELLKQKLAHKDEVIAQIMEDFVAVKKRIGESS